MNFTPRSRFSDNVPPSSTRNELLDAYFVQKNTTYTVSKAEKKTVYLEYEWHVHKIKIDSSNFLSSSASEPWAYVRTFSDGHEALTYVRRLNMIEGRLAHSPSGLFDSPIVSPAKQDALSLRKDSPSLYRIRKVNWNVWSVSKIEADNKWRFVKVFYAEQDALDFVRICNESESSSLGNVFCD